MTPTLLGRWQSRLFLLGTIGVLVTSLFAVTLNMPVPFFILAGVFSLGLGWDILYDVWQRRRWDHDWPPVLQLVAGVVEGLFIFLLIYRFNLVNPLPPVSLFWLHYTAVWITTFIASQSLMRILFPRWRYRGGQWL